MLGIRLYVRLKLRSFLKKKEYYVVVSWMHSVSIWYVFLCVDVDVYIHIQFIVCMWCVAVVAPLNNKLVNQTDKHHYYALVTSQQNLFFNKGNGSACACGLGNVSRTFGSKNFRKYITKFNFCSNRSRILNEKDSPEISWKIYTHV